MEEEDRDLRRCLPPVMHRRKGEADTRFLYASAFRR